MPSFVPPFTPLTEALARQGVRVTRRAPLAWAGVFLALVLGALVGGSALQDALGLPWRMGWLQQLASMAVAVAFASALGEPRALLGWHRPRGPWLGAAVATGVAIMAVGVAVTPWLGDAPTRLHGELLVYEATAPGLGEEWTLRGPWLMLLAVAASRVPALDRRPWLVLAFAALPFVALHGLERAGVPLLAMSLFTFVAAMLLGALRLRLDSVWPAVVAHNVANVLSVLVDALRAG